MKLIVGSAALDILGDEFNFTTTLSTDGTYLYLIGGGDSLLDFNDVEAAVKAERAGSTSFTDLIGDDTRYQAPLYPDGWQVDDLAYDYAAPPSALSYAHNAIQIRIFPGAHPGDGTLAKFDPAGTGTTVDNQATTAAPGKPDTSEVHLVWGAPHTLQVTGAVPPASNPNDIVATEIDASALDPANVTLTVFAHALGLNGRIGIAPPGTHTIWQHHSEPLPLLVGDMWRPSDNLLAETLLEELGVASPGTDDTRARGMTRETNWLHGIGINPKTLTIADGSGMSSYDRVTPQALVTILSHDWFSAHRQTMLDALPIAGKSGTLEHVFTDPPLAGNVFAKTGTSNHTRTLAGYVRTPKGIRIFALMVNDWMDFAPDASARLRAFQAAFLSGVMQ